MQFISALLSLPTEEQTEAEIGRQQPWAAGEISGDRT